MKSVRLFVFAIILVYDFSIVNSYALPAPGHSRIFYISLRGDDNNDGSLQHPWKTLDKINNLQLMPGDVVYLNGGDTLNGTLQLHRIHGNDQLPVIIRSYGKKRCIINAKDSAAIVMDSCSYLLCSNIILIGSGRKEGNTKDGLIVNNSHHIQIKHMDIARFQKAGLLIHNSFTVKANDVYAHDNGFSGIYISGEYGDKLHCKDIQIIGCHAENNPGDPTNFSNHSGNGILAGFCTNVLIDSCVANSNGWDMPRTGNGPVGIWCFEADIVVIQHCISYENKTSKGGEDGGGYDLDGGTTNSIIQYCLSYRNSGSAFGIFQYDGASPWHDNVIRFCISEDDGNVSAAHAAAYIWNSSHDSSQFNNFLFYNNTLYNSTGNAVAYASESEHSGFQFYNNIFVAKESLLRGDYEKDVFLGNDWWSLTYGFRIDSTTDFVHWTKQRNREYRNGKLQGLNVEPLFINAGNTLVKSASLLSSFNHYQLRNTTALSHAGIDLQLLFHIDDGGVDFNYLPIKKKGVGACLK